MNQRKELQKWQVESRDDAQLFQQELINIYLQRDCRIL